MSLKFKALESHPDITEGRVYEITGLDPDGDPYFLDDADDRNFAMGPNGELRNSGQFEIVPAE